MILLEEIFLTAYGMSGNTDIYLNNMLRNLKRDAEQGSIPETGWEYPNMGVILHPRNKSIVAGTDAIAFKEIIVRCRDAISGDIQEGLARMILDQFVPEKLKARNHPKYGFDFGLVPRLYGSQDQAFYAISDGNISIHIGILGVRELKRKYDEAKNIMIADAVGKIPHDTVFSKLELLKRYTFK